MVSFSIDFLTGNDIPFIGCSIDLSLDRSKLSLDDSSGSDGLPRRSPSPSSSESFLSTSSDSVDALTDVLLSFDKHLESNQADDKPEKPPHSYIALISMAIIDNEDKKLILADIYRYIMDKFPYYNTKSKAWRNSIRHNLSLNECFVKSGRANNGKGHYWSIHPACIEDFSKGDFRRRQARRRARKSMKDSTRHLPEISYPGYGFSMGYVPMTASQIAAYQPYPTTPLYYPTYPSLTQGPSFGNPSACMYASQQHLPSYAQAYASSPLSSLHHTSTSVPSLHHVSNPVPTLHRASNPVPSLHHVSNPVPTLHRASNLVPSLHHASNPVPTLHRASNPVPSLHHSSNVMPSTHHASSLVPSVHHAANSLPSVQQIQSLYGSL